MVAAAEPVVAAKLRVRDARRVPPLLSVTLALLLLIVVALRFAEPIQDGDIFWQMAYGSQMLARGSLRLDHAQFSWMPASNALIYCAWIAELLFLAVWKAAGVAGLFALRYLSVLTMLGLMALYAARLRLIARPECWLVLLIVLLASVVATFPKPEMLSLVLWNALVFCGFGLLEAARKMEARTRNLLPWIYAMPVIMLVWVNSHGGFILAAPFIAILTISGFFLLPRRAAWHMVMAALLCLLATAANPYGLAYPLQLLAGTLGQTARPDIAWNNAFQPTFSAAGHHLHLPELLVWMSLGIFAACALRRRGWIIVLALFLAYVPLDIVYVRSSFLLPALFGYGVLYLACDAKETWPRAARITPAFATLLFLFFGGRAVADSYDAPQSGSWLGFGIGYSQPVDEAEFLARGAFGPRIYNSYNAGGYLLWRLFPRYKVMVDARSFPYVDWFGELRQFTLTRDPQIFRSFLDRHPADVALVDFQEDGPWRSFLKQPDWRPAFYGPSSAVFVKADEAKGPVQAADSLQHLRNAADGARVFDFATAAGDYRTAWSLLDQMNGSLRGQADPAELQRMNDYRAGHAALRAGNYDRAWTLFQTSFRYHPFEQRDGTILLLLRALQKIGPDDPRAPGLRAGLSRLMAQE